MDDVPTSQFGVTHLVTHKTMHQQFACKSIAMQKLINQDDIDVVCRELHGAYEDRLLEHLRVHERPKSNIIRMIENLETVSFRSKFDSWPPLSDVVASEDGKGKLNTMFHLDQPMYLLGFLANQSRVYLINKEFNVAHFLESWGKVEEALEVATDPDYRFELVIQLGKLDIAKVFSLFDLKHKGVVFIILDEDDVGVVMGIQGTEVAKESSDIIILDDDFSSVVQVDMLLTFCKEMGLSSVVLVGHDDGGGDKGCGVTNNKLIKISCSRKSMVCCYKANNRCFKSLQEVIGIRDGNGNGAPYLMHLKRWTVSTTALKTGMVKKNNRGRDGFLQGIEAHAQGFAFGVSGVVRKPVESARQNGILGLAHGLGRAFLGFVVQPVSGALEPLEVEDHMNIRLVSILVLQDSSSNIFCFCLLTKCLQNCFVFALGGFVLVREDVKKWWLWGYWSSPRIYTMNGIVMNEFLGNQWNCYFSFSVLFCLIISGMKYCQVEH
ncbi:unnamed protein product [Lactuca saligna]|uniref:COPA/B TPR domain-containing protein n=1 Tax=Lactuca saligna TaxID=75948 RepID=A0AA35YLL1_LACSI|nr:unnamed protein product [Lactuca saligna]